LPNRPQPSGTDGSEPRVRRHCRFNGIVSGAEVSSSQFAAKVGSQSLTITAESDKLVLFGGGIEADAAPLTWGQTASIHLATRTLRLLH